MVSKDIITAMYEFKKHQLKEPNGIYLGFGTRRDLCAEPGIRAYLDGYSAVGEREKFNGVRIYVVDEEKHLAVG
jgi:hypothetical protein